VNDWLWSWYVWFVDDVIICEGFFCALLLDFMRLMSCMRWDGVKY
jgi:hypothetical protein